MFPVRASVSSTGLREVSVTWTRPRLISPSTLSIALSRRITVVYVLSSVEDFGQERKKKISMVCKILFLRRTCFALKWLNLLEIE